jgi:hypothetical protein
MICVGQFAHMEKKGHAYTDFVIRPEGNRTIGRLGHSWKDKIIVHLKEIFWVDVTQNREIGEFF